MRTTERIVRLNEDRWLYEITVEDPIVHPSLDDKQEAAKAMMTEVNQVLERWIRQRPADWLWLHRRWDRP